MIRTLQNIIIVSTDIFYYSDGSWGNYTIEVANVAFENIVKKHSKLIA